MNDHRERPDPWGAESAPSAGRLEAGSAALARLLALRRLGPRHAAFATLRISRAFRAPAQRLFGAWLDADVTPRWLFATAGHPLELTVLDPRVGGAFRLSDRRLGGIVKYAGTYLDIAPSRRLVFTLSIDDGTCSATRVTVLIEPRRTGSALTLTHDNVPRSRASHLDERWTGALYGLAETLAENAAGTLSPGRGS